MPNIDFILEANLSEVAMILSNLEENVDRFVGKYEIKSPDIIISTNMFNDQRFAKQKTKCSINTTWQDLMLQLISLTSTNTQLCIIPATEHRSIISKREIIFEKTILNIK